MTSGTALAGLGLAVVLSTSAPAEGPPRPLPVGAHNCYAEDRADNPRLAEALALGIDNIEIDLGWDAAAGRLIVGHDASPRPGVAYPTPEASLFPALEAQRAARRPDGAPTVLTIDWKTDRPEAVRRFKDLLDAHPDWFSSAPKAAESPLTPRGLTVCFSGSDAAKDAYDALVPPGGTYRAFRDRVFGAGAKHEPDVSAYVPGPSTAYHRFLAFHWGAIEPGGPAVAGEWTLAEARRLASLVELAHRQGFRVRFYCLNGHTGAKLGGYRFADDEAARVRWVAAASAGVDWVASDEYREIVAALGSAQATPAPDVPSFARDRPTVRSGEPIFRFNGRDLAGFYAYTKSHGYEDPQRVFTVVDGQIRVSGEDWGGLATGGNFSNYHLVVEWRWGEKTWGNRTKAARDSGILVHCTGPDGAVGGQWMESIEYQIIEGGTGDLLLVGGRTHPRLTCEARTGADGQPYFERGAPAVARDRGRINWWGRDPAWKDQLGFRGRRDVERPSGEWNTTEVICDGGRISAMVNGLLVNDGTDASPTEGKIQFQSEGAEIFFRRIEVRPLIRP
jgi:hypothetical protein